MCGKDDHAVRLSSVKPVDVVRFKRLNWLKAAIEVALKHDVSLHCDVMRYYMRCREMSHEMS